jgi:hypothetical protein
MLQCPVFQSWLLSPSSIASRCAGAERLVGAVLHLLKFGSKTEEPHLQEARPPVLSLGVFLLFEIRQRIPKERLLLSLVVLRAAR